MAYFTLYPFTAELNTEINKGSKNCSLWDPGKKYSDPQIYITVGSKVEQKYVVILHQNIENLHLNISMKSKCKIPKQKIKWAHVGKRNSNAL